MKEFTNCLEAVILWSFCSAVLAWSFTSIHYLNKKIETDAYIQVLENTIDNLNEDAMMDIVAETDEYCQYYK